MRDINILILGENSESRKLVENILKHKNFNCSAKDADSLEEDIKVALNNIDVDVVITIGGIGLSRKDKTADIIRPLLDKEISSFNSLLSTLAVDEMGVRAGCYNLLAGVMGEKAIFCLPNNTQICGIAASEIIAYQLIEIMRQIRG